MEPILLRASEESKNQRLDAFLASSLDGLTRSQATRLIESGEIAVNGRAVSKSYKLAGGEDIAVTLPEPEPLSGSNTFTMQSISMPGWYSLRRSGIDA